MTKTAPNDVSDSTRPSINSSRRRSQLIIIVFLCGFVAAASSSVYLFVCLCTCVLVCVGVVCVAECR